MQKSSNIFLSIIGALIAAVVGGVIWGAIAIWTNYELGLVAWLIGGLTGYGVVLFAKGSINVGHQLVAVIASLIGIVLGKYVIFCYIGSQLVGSLDIMFKKEVFDVFTSNITELFQAMDIIFVALAVVTAWQLPRNLMAKKLAKANSAANSFPGN